MPIQSIMKKPVVVSDNISLKDTIKLMIENKRNSVQIVDKDGKFISEVDVVSIIKAVLPDYIEDANIAARFAGRDFFEDACEKAKDMPILEFMMKCPKTLRKTSTLTEAAVVVKGKQTRIPVLDADKKPIGVVTRRELKREIARILKIEDN